MEKIHKLTASLPHSHSLPEVPRLKSSSSLDRISSLQFFDDQYVADLREPEELDPHPHASQHAATEQQVGKLVGHDEPSESSKAGPELGSDIETLSGETSGAEKVPTNDSESSKRSAKLVTTRDFPDIRNPKDWSDARKWATVVIVSSYAFMSPLSSSMLAPARYAIAADLHIDSEVELGMVNSSFVLAFAVGPLLLSPLSEIYGRAIVLQCAALFYLIWNLACGAATTKEELIVFRFLAGLGGSAPLSIGGGVLGDCFTPEKRGRAGAVYSLMPLLGPSVGPIIAGFIVENLSWRWAFWITSIVSAIIQVVGFFLLQETYQPVLLERKVRQLRKETSDDSWHTLYRPANTRLRSLLKTSFSRPFILLGTQPIVQVLALFMAYLYGLLYLMLLSFSQLWINPDYYGEAIDMCGLNYISLAVGFLLGSQIGAFLNNHIYLKLKAQNGGVGRPEFRLPLLAVGAILNPIGLLIYGWTAENRVLWIAPDIGVAIFATGTVVSFQCIQIYLVDAYQRYAASALAAAVVLRSLAGFAFSLFASDMFAQLHYGWGNTVLAFISIAIGIPAPILLWKFGEKLRGKSQFATT